MRDLWRLIDQFALLHYEECLSFCEYSQMFTIPNINCRLAHKSFKLSNETYKALNDRLTKEL